MYVGLTTLGSKGKITSAAVNSLSGVAVGLGVLVGVLVGVFVGDNVSVGRGVADDVGVFVSLGAETVSHDARDKMTSIKSQRDFFILFCDWKLPPNGLR